MARRPLVGGDTLVGEDEVTAVADEHRELMKGDPLRGVHAFYAASAREWWAPMFPLRRVFRRNALVAALDKPSEFAGRAIHEWTAQVFRDETNALLSGQYRLMVRTEREKARERKKYDGVKLAAYTDDEIAAIESQYDRETRRGSEPGCGSSTANSVASTTWATRSGCGAGSCASTSRRVTAPRSISSSKR